ncbi:hypothetical protein [Portibacter lacus]|uniref:Uncharacterized protein n=1 Tax=Portibacter lacus TaxID=1099794 RepID=A0AA37SQJ1_9BACT|nr:hypothetical protein [Portibacter lacus]GLR17962.1 hypothetical protein GCM10007940_25770 [Portibacter lacus]
MLNQEDKESIADKVSEAAFELEISNSTRAFLNGLDAEQSEPKRKRIFYLAGIAASLLILIVSVVTINLSHNDGAIADEFGINKQIARNGNNISDDNFTSAVRAYYKGDYTEANSWLSKSDDSEGNISEYKDWLRLLIALKTMGSKSETFNNQLDSILENEQHEFYRQAVFMKKDLDLFWRKFLID